MTDIGSMKLFNICKALGVFFKSIGYVQGMNFYVSFILEISAFEEFETFNFIVNFWKKQKNLYFGIFDNDFLMVNLIKEFVFAGVK